MHYTVHVSLPLAPHCPSQKLALMSSAAEAMNQLLGSACVPQAEAERRKRAQILESEGDRQSKINVAEGDKAQVILSSEAAKQDAINRATGQAHQACHNTTALCSNVLELVYLSEENLEMPSCYALMMSLTSILKCWLSCCASRG